MKHLTLFKAASAEKTILSFEVDCVSFAVPHVKQQGTDIAETLINTIPAIVYDEIRNEFVRFLYESAKDSYYSKEVNTAAEEMYSAYLKLLELHGKGFTANIKFVEFNEDTEVDEDTTKLIDGMERN